MKKLSLLFITLSIQLSIAQSKNVFSGIKLGADNFKYMKGEWNEPTDKAFGFYAGGFLNFVIHDEFRIQAEILYVKHKRDEKVNDVKTEYHNIPGTYAGAWYFEITEKNIQIPIMAQYYFTDTFYSEIGPQFGYILEKEISFSDDNNSVVDGETITTKLKYDTFDFSVSLGFGYYFNKHIGVSARYCFGLIEKDNQIKSSVLNFGLQYKI